MKKPTTKTPLEASLSTMPLCEIGRLISKDWVNVNFAARPYLDVIKTLDKITDNYICDSGYEIVARFLCNAGQYKGETARAIKKELNKRLKNQ